VAALFLDFSFTFVLGRYGCRGIGVEIDAKVAAAARRRLAAENLQHLVTVWPQALHSFVW